MLCMVTSGSRSWNKEKYAEAEPLLLDGYATPDLIPSSEGPWTLQGK
jgi:hypothetical protein